jgi:hypothetical protein
MVELGQVGTAWLDAVEGLAFQVHLIGGGVDLPVEGDQPAKGLGMLTVEGGGCITLTLPLGQLPLGFGQLGSDAVPLGGGQG